MDYQLRKAVKADEARINELFCEMLRTVYHKEDVQGYREGELDRYFTDGEDWICVAEEEGEIVGFLSIEVHREDFNYLYYDDFCVTEAHRNKGIGSAMMRKAERYAKSLGIDMVTLHVEDNNAAARRLYNRKKFERFRQDLSRIFMIKYLD